MNWFKQNDSNHHSLFTKFYEKKDTCIIKCDIEYLKNKSIMNWTKNRPPDNVRVSDISKYYIENNIDLVPGIIHVWNNGGIYIVYDGIHRLLAAFESEKNMTIIMNLYSTINEQDIINEFININKSISVPSIYLEDVGVIKKMVCQNVADELCRRYPAFISPSRKPFIYNFNRDNLVEFISTLEIDFYKTGIDKIIINELVGLNFYALEFVKRNNIKPPKKCDFHKFYLFYLDKPIIKDRLEKAVR